MFVVDTKTCYHHYQLSNAVIKKSTQIGFHFEFDFVYKPKLIIMIFVWSRIAFNIDFQITSKRYALSELEKEIVQSLKSVTV